MCGYPLLSTSWTGSISVRATAFTHLLIWGACSRRLIWTRCEPSHLSFNKIFLQLKTCSGDPKSWCSEFGWIQYINNLNTKHSKSEQLTFCPVFKWFGHVIRHTIRILDILCNKTDSFVWFSDHHLKTRHVWTIWIPDLSVFWWLLYLDIRIAIAVGPYFLST